MISEIKMHQNSRIDKLIQSCSTETQFKSMVNLIRNANLSKVEKLTWFSMLKEKASSVGIVLGELYEA